METQIKIDNNLISEAMEMGDFRSKKALVESALKDFIKKHQRKQMLEFAGKNIWTGNLNEMREI